MMRRPSGRGGRVAVSPDAAIGPVGSVEALRAGQVEEELVHLRLEVGTQEPEVLLLGDDGVRWEQQVQVALIERGGGVARSELPTAARPRRAAAAVALNRCPELRAE